MASTRSWLAGTDPAVPAADHLAGVDIDNRYTAAEPVVAVVDIDCTEAAADRTVEEDSHLPPLVVRSTPHIGDPPCRPAAERSRRPVLLRLLGHIPGLQERRIRTRSLRVAVHTVGHNLL